MLRSTIYLSIFAVFLLSTGCTTNAATRAKVEDRSLTEPNYGSTVIITPAENAKTTSPTVETTPYVTPPAPQPLPQQHASSVHSSSNANAAVTSLVSSADNSIKHGDYRAASAAIERALRLDPKNADLWHRLAQVRLRQSEYAQVESLSLKSNALSNGNKPLMARNWSLISKARRLSGDGVGADEAEVRAYQLSH
ncbi:MAG: tetratricopeptide repeat protein [Arenicellales bacterium]|jgi:predicted Zn-dependent protease